MAVSIPSSGHIGICAGIPVWVIAAGGFPLALLVTNMSDSTLLFNPLLLKPVKAEFCARCATLQVQMKLLPRVSSAAQSSQVQFRKKVKIRVPGL